MISIIDVNFHWQDEQHTWYLWHSEHFAYWLNSVLTSNNFDKKGWKWYFHNIKNSELKWNHYKVQIKVSFNRKKKSQSGSFKNCKRANSLWSGDFKGAASRPHHWAVMVMVMVTTVMMVVMVAVVMWWWRWCDDIMIWWLQRRFH